MYSLNPFKFIVLPLLFSGLAAGIKRVSALEPGSINGICKSLVVPHDYACEEHLNDLHLGFLGDYKRWVYSQRAEDSIREDEFSQWAASSSTARASNGCGDMVDASSRKFSGISFGG